MLHLRPIKQEDNTAIALVIRKALEEYGVNKPGTVYTDPTTDDLYTLFKPAKSIYWVATYHEELIGGCGIYPTKGLPEGYAELVKLYLKKEHRGTGLGKVLMQQAIQSAKEMGYTHLYLESLPELNQAVGLYESLGFKKMNQPLGDSGHFACNLWMEYVL